MATAYTVLGVAPTATAEEIRAAYRSKAAEVHPDKAGSEEERAKLSKKAVLVNVAWSKLGTAEERAKYDERLEELARQHERPMATQASDAAAAAAAAEQLVGDIAHSAGLDPATCARARSAAGKTAAAITEVRQIFQSFKQ